MFPVFTLLLNETPCIASIDRFHVAFFHDEKGKLLGTYLLTPSGLIKLFTSLPNFAYFALKSINKHTYVNTKTFSTEIIAN